MGLFGPVLFFRLLSTIAICYLIYDTNSKSQHFSLNLPSCLSEICIFADCLCGSAGGWPGIF
jgi:hypothetical protein